MEPPTRPAVATTSPSLLQFGLPPGQDCSYTMRTGVPTGISLASRETFAFGIRMQPCDGRPGMSPGSLVPWMPTTPPPGQSDPGASRRSCRTPTARRPRRRRGCAAARGVEAPGGVGVAALPDPIPTTPLRPERYSVARRLLRWTPRPCAPHAAAKATPRGPSRACRSGVWGCGPRAKRGLACYAGCGARGTPPAGRPRCGSAGARPCGRSPAAPADARLRVRIRDTGDGALVRQRVRRHTALRSRAGGTVSACAPAAGRRRRPASAGTRP